MKKLLSSFLFIALLGCGDVEPEIQKHSPAFEVSSDINDPYVGAVGDSLTFRVLGSSSIGLTSLKVFESRDSSETEIHYEIFNGSNEFDKEVTIRLNNPGESTFVFVLKDNKENDSTKSWRTNTN